MAQVYAELLARHGQVLLIGADVPQVSAPLLLRAAEAIRLPQVPFALGPAHDGGFWLFGGTRPVPLEIWRSFPYSPADTGVRMAGALRSLGTTAWLSMLADTDEPEDIPSVLSALEETEPCLPEQARLAHWLRSLPKIARSGRPHAVAP